MSAAEVPLVGEAANMMVTFENYLERSPALDGCVAAHHPEATGTRIQCPFDVAGSG